MEKVDAEIGKIVDAIDKQDLWKNTVSYLCQAIMVMVWVRIIGTRNRFYREEVVECPFDSYPSRKKNAGKEMPQLINEGVDFFASVCD